MLVPWNKPEGKKRLFESKYALAFYALAHLFERQATPTYCGIASAVMVFNALRNEKKGLRIQRELDVEIPAEKGGGMMMYNAYTQMTFLTSETDFIKKREIVEGRHGEIFDPGLSLEDLVSKLRLHLCEVRIVPVKNCEPASIERFRQDLMAYVNERQVYLIANFDSVPIGRVGGGHFSPVCAYHPETDSCLVMDVAGHKQPWFRVGMCRCSTAPCAPETGIIAAAT